MPTAYAYLRISHQDQADTGNSIRTQEDIVLRKFADLQWDTPDLRMGAIYADLAVSGYKKPFLRRPEGAKLHAKLQRGDVVIFSRVDRAFRNIRDQLRMVDLWESMGVTFVFCDYNLDSRTAIGKMFLHMLGIIAQMHSDMQGERIAAGIATKKRLGLAHRGHIKRGQKALRSATLGKYVVVENEVDFEIAKKIAQLKESGLGYILITDEIEDWLAAREGRKSYRGIRSRYAMSRSTCIRMHQWFLAEQQSKMVSDLAVQCGLLPAPTEQSSDHHSQPA